jgi:hypothetical protein
MGDLYYSLNLSTKSQLVSSSSLEEFQLDGVVAALAIFHLLVEPCPISPFLIYTACFTDATCLIKKPDYILAMIPDRQTHALVAAILRFKKNDLVPAAATHHHNIAS